MKTKKMITVVSFICLAIQAYAIEGLTLTVSSTNAVLSWPSNPTETYLIQYRHTLAATDSWTTLADFYPAAGSTNKTFFADTNRVDSGAGLADGSPGTGDITPPDDDAGLSAEMSLDDILSIIMPLMPNDNGGKEQSIDPADPAPTGDTNALFSTVVPGTGFYRVVRDGVHLWGITNGSILSGVVTIPVELANPSGKLATMDINENSSPVGNAISSAPFANPLCLTLDTALMSNGVHQIVGSARWEDTNGGAWEADSPTISVTVSNEITFENWMPYFGELANSLLIRATSAHPSTDWQIDVYDSQYAYVGSFVGHTDNGDISVVWNLQDYSGVYHTNDNFFICKISTEYVDPVTPPTYRVKDPWPSGGGGWVFASQHAFDNLTDCDLLYNEFSDMLNAVSSSWTVRPQSGTPFPIHFQGGFEAADWATFRQALYDNGSRNLIYFGHGGPNGIGYNPHDTNVFVSATEIATVLHTIPAGQTNIHRFRFVFLDGCSTGKGTLPESFGMLHRENVEGIDYYDASMRRSAFCGWSADKYVGLNLGHTVNYDHVSFISMIQLYMAQGYGLKQSIDMSASQPNIPYVNTSELKVYGYWDLHVGTDNN